MATLSRLLCLSYPLNPKLSEHPFLPLYLHLCSLTTRYLNSCFISKTFHLLTLKRYIKSADCIASLPCCSLARSPLRTQNTSLIHSEFSTFQSVNEFSNINSRKNRQPQETLNSKWQRLPRQLHRNPTEAGLKFRSLPSKAHHRYCVVIKKVFHFNLDAGYQTSCFEVLMQSANPGAQDPT